MCESENTGIGQTPIQAGIVVPYRGPDWKPGRRPDQAVPLVDPSKVPEGKKHNLDFPHEGYSQPFVEA